MAAGVTIVASNRNRVEVRDRGLKRFFRRLNVYNGYEVVVGIPEAEGSKVRKGGVTMAQIAASQEYGAPDAGIPQRSFLRDTFDENESKYNKILAKGVDKVVKSNQDPRRTLFVLGETARADVIKRINTGIGAPLKDATIKAKRGKTLQLVDKGQLRAAITSIVRKEEPNAE